MRICRVLSSWEYSVYEIPNPNIYIIPIPNEAETNTYAVIIDTYDIQNNCIFILIEHDVRARMTVLNWIEKGYILLDEKFKYVIKQIDPELRSDYCYMQDQAIQNLGFDNKD